VNGPPTQREFELIISRLRIYEKDIEDLKAWKNRQQGIAAILGFVGGIFSAIIVTAIARALFGG
jgi:hypothetical protein